MQVTVVDKVCDIAREAIKEFFPQKKIELHYVSPYIGLTVDGKTNNFITFVPTKGKVNFCGRYNKSLPQLIIQAPQDNPTLEYQGQTTGILLQTSLLQDPNNLKTLKEVIKILADEYILN